MAVQTKIIPPTPSADNYQLLIKKLLLNIENYHPDQEIVYRDLKRITYRQMIDRIGRLASGLAGVGVEPGDVVAVLDWDSHRYLESFFAIPMMGAVLHTVNVRLSPEQILYTMNHAEDKVVMVHEDFLPLIAQIAPRLETVKKIILLQDAAQPPESDLDFAAEYEDLLEASGPDYDFPDFDENSAATLFYTTGTTGDPKGVFFSHRQLVLHSLAVGMAVGTREARGRFTMDDVYMPITPMFHVHAWGIPYVATMMGVKQVYPGRYEPAMLLRLLVTEKVTFSHCVPTILHMLVSAPAAADVDLTGWKVVIGGSAFPKGLYEAVSARGATAYSGYGMSETCPVLTMGQLKPNMADWSDDEKADYAIKTGYPIPMVEIDIVDPDMNPLPHDDQATGELVVRTPWLTQGYLKNPEGSEVLWKDGWLHTGDIAKICPEGFVQITDRLKDVIKTGGEWVSSLELESLISQYPGVSEAAVIGVPDDKWGERPLAMVVCAPGAELKEQELKDHLAGFAQQGVISKYAVPDRCVVVPELPKTSVGKLNKKVMRTMAAKGEI